MVKKILVAFDDSENAMRTVKYIACLFTPDSKVTLLSVIKNTAYLCERNSPELTSYFLSQPGSFCLLENKKKEFIEGAIQKAKQILLKAGFEEKNIDLKVKIQKKGIAKDIVNESQLGYDTIAIGRRGLSSIEEIMLGSVSQKVISLVKNISILIVS